VEPLVDIWSLGCVFSEAAVWLVLGKNELRRYHQLRCSETGKIHDFDSHGCFHDSETVLESVGDMHHEIAGSIRECDPVTKAVIGSRRRGTMPAIKGLVAEMLTTKDRRSHAKQIWANAQDIIKDAEVALAEAARDPYSMLHSTTSLPGTRPLPPVLPRSPFSDPTNMHSFPHQAYAAPKERPESNGLYDCPVADTPTPSRSLEKSPMSPERGPEHSKKISVNTISGPSTPTRSTTHDPIMETTNALGGLGIHNASGPDSPYTGSNRLKNIPEIPFVSPPVPHRTVDSLKLYLHKESSARLTDDERPLLNSLEKRDYVCCTTLY